MQYPLNELVGKVVVALLDDRLGFTDQRRDARCRRGRCARGLVGGFRRDVSQVFGFRSCSTHYPKADLFLESDRAGEKVMEGDQVVT